MKKLLKAAVACIAVVCMIPFAGLSAFGRLRPVFSLFAHLCALFPGILGDYLRAAYYWMTLKSCSLDSRISFGTFFAHPNASIGSRVYIGSYCVMGSVEIGSRTQIASNVQVLSGRHQHRRDASGNMKGSESGTFTHVRIGPDCWIGAGAIIMADVGEGTTVGAGAVVVSTLAAHVVAVGNPARVVKAASDIDGN
jgi:virginiamycin A acetyltransferase